VDGVELFRLGRTLAKIGERAIPESGFHRMPASMRAIMVDVFEHPGTSVQEITARTGFPQSLVSVSIAKLREAGVLVTTTDPADRRRTRIQAAADVPARARRFSTPVDTAIAAAIGTDDPDRVAEVVTLLETLAERLDSAPG